MSITEIILLGVALSMDAFAVTLSNAVAFRGTGRARRFLMPVFFGVFQGVMPVIGFVLGSLVSEWVDQYAGLITFVILGFIGGKMIWDSLHDDGEDEEGSGASITIPVLFFQAIATSIDALAVGVSFAMLSINIGVAASIIGLTTFLCCIVALFIQKGVGRVLGDKAAIVGGLVLIAIGLKSLFL